MIRLLISATDSSSFLFFYVCESSLLEASKIFCYTYAPTSYFRVSVLLLLGANWCFKTYRQLRVWNSFSWSASAFLKSPWFALQVCVPRFLNTNMCLFFTFTYTAKQKCITETSAYGLEGQRFSFGIGRQGSLSSSQTDGGPFLGRKRPSVEDFH